VTTMSSEPGSVYGTRMDAKSLWVLGVQWVSGSGLTPLDVSGG